MGQLGIYRVEGGLHDRGLDVASDQRTKITASIANDNHLLRPGQMLRDLLLDRFGSDIVAGIQDNQILDPADDAPVSPSVDFALIAGMEPAVTQDARGVIRAIPVTGENVWAAN